MVIEEWKHEVQKIEEKLKVLEKKYIDRCKELKVWKIIGFFLQNV